MPIAESPRSLPSSDTAPTPAPLMTPPPPMKKESSKQDFQCQWAKKEKGQKVNEAEEEEDDEEVKEEETTGGLNAGI